MTTRTRAWLDLAFYVRSAALVAGLALTALTGPLLAGPLGGQGYAPGNGYGDYGYGYGPSNGYGGQVVVSGGPAVGGCASCGVPAAASVHPGPKVDCRRTTTSSRGRRT